MEPKREKTIATNGKHTITNNQPTNQPTVFHARSTEPETWGRLRGFAHEKTSREGGWGELEGRH